MRYVGLTDDPAARRAAHGNPTDWCEHRFETERAAREWEEDMLSRPGYTGGPAGKGWHFGYIYTIRRNTIQ